MTAPGDDRQEARLRWRCRRGLLELDLILERFLDTGYRFLTSEEQLIFERLLEMPDLQLLAWLHGQEEPEDGMFRNIVKKIY